MRASQASAGHLLWLVRTGTATTRGELQRITGLSRSTVSSRLDRLFRAGWLRESAGGVDGSTGGRPASRLEFDPSHAVVLAADLDTRHARAALLDLGGTVLAEHGGPLLIEDGPEVVLSELGSWFRGLLERARVGPERLLGVGLSVPGPVDRVAGRLVEPPIMPGWDGYPVAERLRAALGRPRPGARAGGDGRGTSGPPGDTIPGEADPAGPAHPAGPGDRGDRDGSPAGDLASREETDRPSGGMLLPPEALPVLLENDANLMALAEQRAGHPDCPAFLLVKVSTGIGAGLVVDGTVHRGVDGGAGDLGHVRLPDAAGQPCRCGFSGCLAAVASGWAVARQLTEAGVPAASGSDVRALLAAGHPEAVRLAESAGRRVGEVLATAVTLFNPGVLMLSGDLAGTPFLTGVRELLYRRAMPRTTAPLQVVTGRLGARAGLLGAAALVVEECYAPDRADARLDAADRR